MSDSFKDTICTTTTIHLDWRDRLKVLCGMPLIIKIDVETEHVVGRTSTTGSAWTSPWCLWHRRESSECMSIAVADKAREEKP